MQFQKLLAIAFFAQITFTVQFQRNKNPNLKYWTGWKKVDVWMVGWLFFVNISEIKGICSAFLRTLSTDMLQCVIFPKGHIFPRTVSNEMQQRSICISPQFIKEEVMTAWNYKLISMTGSIGNTGKNPPSFFIHI